MLCVASAVTSTCCSVLKESRHCRAFQPSRQLAVVSTRRIATMTVSTTVSPRIFISYKRGDTLRPVSHLKGALERRGMRPVVDYALDGGKDIWPAIEEAIEQSNIAAVVVSQNYHYSPRCLNELVKILKCRKKGGLIVLPVFWEIDARVLQEPSSPFLENIGQGEGGFKQKNPHQVQRWRKALQALGQIIGFPVSASLDNTEAELIEDLADKMAAKWYRSVRTLPPI